MYIETNEINEQNLLNFIQINKNKIPFPEEVNGKVNEWNTALTKESIKLSENILEQIFIILHKQSIPVLNISWKSDIPNNSGGLSLREIGGNYFIFSDDLPCQGPITSWNECLNHEYFTEHFTIEFEIESKSIPIDQLEKIAFKLIDKSIHKLEFTINQVQYKVEDGIIANTDTLKYN
ncbi:MAG: hypothetical protein CFE24_14845 [Flavobacterium sp. BFFFF2]|nr:MAG: hypothetical protein CFE24_14845 [Flavobacterium sp. BFFFF2]